MTLKTRIAEISSSNKHAMACDGELNLRCLVTESGVLDIQRACVVGNKEVLLIHDTSLMVSLLLIDKDGAILYLPLQVQ